MLAFALLVRGAAAHAQTRERPVTFDVAGRVAVITPPLAARLGLTAPVWPVSGDYVDARLYSLDDSSRAYVLVVRRREDVLERTSMDSLSRVALADAVARGDREARLATRSDSSSTMISEPVRGTFIANQTLLGITLFGPAAATAIDNVETSMAAYFLVAGGSFFIASGVTATQPVSRAQNHLAWQGARQGAVAANLALYALTGDDHPQDYAATTFVGGIIGDISGFQIAAPMTDAEAHGTSHGATVAAVLTAGAFGSAGAYERRSSARAAAGAIVGAGVLGYPLGLRFVRTAPYRVTAGDVGAMGLAEVLGIGTAITLAPEHSSSATTYGLLTAGFAAGALVGDRALVRPFDHSESDARVLALGVTAGSLIGLAFPTLAQAQDGRVYWGSMTAGGILGLLTAEQLNAAPRARPGDRNSESGRGADAGATVRPSRVGVHVAPEGIVMAALGQRGRHSVLSLTF